jgi:hypothetical protein
MLQLFYSFTSEWPVFQVPLLRTLLSGKPQFRISAIASVKVTLGTYRSGKRPHSLVPSYLPLLSRHQGITTTCRLPFSLHCTCHLCMSPLLHAHGTVTMLTLAYIVDRGTISTIFLYLVDVKKSRVECDEFVEAEANREAFGETSS